MKIKIINSFKNAHEAKGLTVIIDVFRAFTTACFLFNNRAKRIIPVATIKGAYRLKKKHPQWVLMGERQGKKQPWFDYGNSSAEIEKVDFEDKSVILTTSSGTQGITRAVQADEVITGAFVNVEAVVRYIKTAHPKIVSLVCTDDRWPDNEDFMLADYIKKRLMSKSIDFKQIKKHLENHSCAYGFLKKPMTPYAQKDFYLCLELNRFDFILRAYKRNSFIYLKKVSLSKEMYW